MINRKVFVFYLILFFASVSLIPQISNSHPLDNWHLRNHFPAGTVLCRAIYANNFFVAVGWDAMGYGVIYASSDGINWTERNRGQTNPLDCIAYGNNTLVVGGAYGTILTSFDGITWTERESGTAKTFYAITYANNTFVAVGESGGIFTSPDGITWNERDSGMTNPLYGVAYGNNKFVAGGRTSGHILTSPDGITWTAGEYIGYSYDWYDIIYANNTFVGVGTMGTIYTSPDGVTWTCRYLPPVEWIPDFYGITYGNNTFVAVGHWWGDSETFVSSDGIIWTQTQPGTESQSLLFAVTFGNNTFVAFAGGLSGFVTVDSTDGVNWTERGPGTGVCLIDVAYGNNTFVAMGGSGGGRIDPVLLTSIDGITWLENVEVNYLYPMLSAVAFGNNTFVAVGQNGIVLTSFDGISWSETYLKDDCHGVGSSPRLTDVTYINNTFIVQGVKCDSTYLSFTSQDGVTWTERGPGPPLKSIIYANATFVAVGGNDDIFTSPDGITWTKRWTMYDGHINDLTYGNNLLLAVGVSFGNPTGEFALVATSPDGITWTPTTIKTETVLSGVTYSNHTFVAVGTNGTILTSFDGTTWEQRQSGMGDFHYYDEGYLRSVTYGNNTFVTVGTYGTILQSDPVGNIISTPNTPKGPSSGANKTSYSFSTQGSSSNIDHDIQYLFDWNDGTNSGWLPIGTTSASKSWTSAGIYNVRAQARCANHTSVLSSWSEPLSITIYSPPSPPINVQASDGIYMDKVQVNWTASLWTTSYTVYRATSSKTWARKTALGSTSETFFNDTTAVPKTTYYYYVKASNASGTSGFSSYDTGYRSDGSPPIPTDVSATDGTYTDKVQVTWAASSGATSYTVHRATSTSRRATKVAIGTTTETTYDDITASVGKTHYYYVTATNSYGTSGYSAYDTGYW